MIDIPQKNYLLRMAEHNEKERPRSRAKKTSKAFIYSLIAAIVICVIGTFLYLRHIGPAPGTTSAQKDTSAPPSPKQSGDSGAVRDRSAQKTNGPGETSPGNSSLQGDEISRKDGSVDSVPEESPADTKQPPAAPADYPRLIGELNAFYSHLDRQPYMQTFGLKEPSKAHFSKLLQKLMDNPPVVTRETDDLLTLLKNTAHFFRILDQENITLLKGILDREKKSFEQILKTFYTLTYQPEYLQKEYSLTIPADALHDYAAFFLNTIGGRLYLFRRDSASRMTVSYYSILVIDRANSEGGSRHGIDLRPAIDSLIEEIENTGKNLRFKDEYLEKLYDLKEKYN